MYFIMVTGEDGDVYALRYDNGGIMWFEEWTAAAIKAQELNVSDPLKVYDVQFRRRKVKKS